MQRLEDDFGEAHFPRYCVIFDEYDSQCVCNGGGYPHIIFEDMWADMCIVVALARVRAIQTLIRDSISSGDERKSRQGATSRLTREHGSECFETMKFLRRFPSSDGQAVEYIWRVPPAVVGRAVRVIWRFLLQTMDGQ